MCAKCCSREGASSALAASYGHCPPASTCTRTSPFSKQRPWWLSTEGTFVNSTRCWRATSSRHITTPSCSSCGSRRTTSKQRSCAGDRLVPWASTGCAGNSRFRAPSGMARRRAIASRRKVAAYLKNGTPIILIPHRERNASWPRPQGSQPRRSATGLRTAGRETAPLRPRRGNILLIFCTSSHRL